MDCIWPLLADPIFIEYLDVAVLNAFVSSPREASLSPSLGYLFADSLDPFHVFAIVCKVPPSFLSSSEDRSSSLGFLVLAPSIGIS